MLQVVLQRRVELHSVDLRIFDHFGYFVQFVVLSRQVEFDQIEEQEVLLAVV